ncbi:hypothetical protein [Vallitalea guaymasensis]|uniref:Uncharacterized protein n=1 Tax=Vallitalea guaymasensis TaxID=1185412 RepID=A0A8J8M8D6_9FIRM|nr:hypothetical protein [Vallitalea guaymasensis]QUH28201.1 hypothetical protein HYG85_04440 [Vallitalea guaymasensis]
MKNKYLILIILICLLVFSACSKQVNNIQEENTNITNENKKTDDAKNNQLPETNILESDDNQANDVNNNDNCKDDIQIQLIKENTHAEYKFFSPDKNNFILEVFYPDEIIDHGHVKTKLYLNSLDNYISDEEYMNSTHKENKTSVIWIDNSRVLLSGTDILNINNNSIEHIDFTGILKKDQWINNYRINTLNTKIAYVLSGKDNIEEVYIYDISNKKWSLIYQQAHNWETGTPYGASIFQIFWDYEDHLYFDTSDIGKNNRIVKYNLSTKETHIFKDNYILESCSPLNKYFILNYFDEKNYVNKSVLLDIINDKIVYEFTGNYCWSDGKYLTLAIANSNSISILSIDNNMILKEKQIDGFNIGYIDFYDKHFHLYMSKKVLGDFGNIYRVKY